jgi:hypothetical protein
MITKKHHLESQIIFKINQCSYEGENRQPDIFVTFISLEDLDDIFTYYGKLPKIFGVGDEVNIEYIQKYSKGEYDKRIISIFHCENRKYYYPLVDFFPSVETLRKNYKRVDWTYDSDVKPFWIIYDNEVYLFSKKNGGRYGDSICILRPKCNPEYKRSNQCDYYLNELIASDSSSDDT